MAKNTITDLSVLDENQTKRFTNRSAKEALQEGKSNKAKDKLRNAFFVLLTLAVVTFVACVAVLDLWGLRTWTLGLFGIDKGAQTTQQTPAEAALSAQQSVLADEKRKLDALEFQLNVKQQTLDDKQKEQDQRDTELAQRKAQLDELNRQVEILQASLQIQYNEITDLVKVINNMEPKAAAAMLEAMQDTPKVATILRNMAQTNAADILNKMTPEFAATIVRQLYPQ